jgi:NTP pyrophosphatase (non-canonical NTP hydrolase)
METAIYVDETNICSVSELNYIRDSIENMNKFNQVEVLRILSKNNNVTLNENKYGIHVNLSEVKKEIIDELNVYIKYVNAQEITLNAIEQKKEDYKNTYFSKDIKDNSKILNSK